MLFPESIVHRAWILAGGTCECRQAEHGHTIPCGKNLRYADQGRVIAADGWEAHLVAEATDGIGYTLENCVILCRECGKRKTAPEI